MIHCGGTTTIDNGSLISSSGFFVTLWGSSPAWWTEGKNHSRDRCVTLCWSFCPVNR